MNLSLYRKAVAAVLVPIVVYYAAKHGLDLNDDQVVALTTIFTGTTVWAVPNG